MGRIHDALQRLADRGHFQMESHEPTVQFIPLAVDQTAPTESVSQTAEDRHATADAATADAATQIESNLSEQLAAAHVLFEDVTPAFADDCGDVDTVDRYEPVVIDAAPPPSDAPVDFHGPEPQPPNSADGSPVELAPDDPPPIAGIEQIQQRVELLRDDSVSELEEAVEPGDPPTTPATLDAASAEVDSALDADEGTAETPSLGEQNRTQQPSGTPDERPIVADLVDEDDQRSNRGAESPHETGGGQVSQNAATQADAVMQLVQQVLGTFPHIEEAKHDQQENARPEIPDDGEACSDSPESPGAGPVTSPVTSDDINPWSKDGQPSTTEGSEGPTAYNPVLDTWAVVSEDRESASEQEAGQDETSPANELFTASVLEEVTEQTAAEIDRSPEVRLPTAYEAVIAQRLSESSYGDRIRQLSQELSESQGDRESQIVLFVSIEGDVQRADGAAALGMLLCEQRQMPTLLIDADFDGKHISASFENKGAGLIEAISGQSPWNASVRRTSSGGLDMLPCGADIGFISPDSEQEEFQQIAQFAEDWRKQYGLIVIDGGPVDSPLIPTLAGTSDAIFACVQLGHNDRQQLATALERLTKAGGNVLGCITTGPTE